jgi:hypothetical protein
VPLVLRGLLYLKVEVGMKKYKLIVDLSSESDEMLEEVDSIHDVDVDRVWLDTGDIVLQLPDEILPYLEESDILGVA